MENLKELWVVVTDNHYLQCIVERWYFFILLLLIWALSMYICYIQGYKEGREYKRIMNLRKGIK